MTGTQRFEYISRQSQVEDACRKVRDSKTIAVDLECENNMHHYGVYLSLIQVTSRHGTFIFDVLLLDDISPLLKILRDESIQKIFHDVGFDFRILNSLHHCIPKNIIDTQLAARMLGIESPGLTTLMDKFMGIKKKRKFQKADWARRPIRRDMLDYAAKDTMYLYKIRNILFDELRKKGRLDWLKEECEDIEKRNFEQKEPGFWGMKGIVRLTDRQRSIAFALYNKRELVAKKADRPVHFVMNNKLMLAISQDPPKNIDGWRNMKGVHPAVKRDAEAFFMTVKYASEKALRMPPKERLFYPAAVKQRMERLKEDLAKVAAKLGMDRDIFCGNEQMKDIAINRNLDSLRPWQARILKEENIKI